MTAEQPSTAATRYIRIPYPQFIQWLVREIFAVSLITYLVYYVLDDLLNGFITSQISMNAILWIVLVFGVLDVAFGKNGAATQEVSKPTTVKQIGRVLFSILVGAVAGGIIWLKTATLDDIRLVVTVLSGMIVVLLSMVILFDEHQKDSES